MLKFAQLATSVKSRYRAADAVTVVAASEQQERTLPGGQGRRSTYDGSIDAPAEAGDEIEGAGGPKSCSQWTFVERLKRAISSGQEHNRRR